MLYHISSPIPNTRFIEITLTVENINDDSLELHLPSWRPGRYELGNFAKNIQKWNAFDDKQHPLSFRKTDKDSWVIDTRLASKVIVKYNYYAAQCDAGSCWTDESLLYINPVHCCLYIQDRLHLPCQLQLDIPKGWEIATGLPHLSETTYQAHDYHQLVDCPLMAASELKQHSYEVNKIKFNIWFNGECQPDWKRIEKDFIAFTKKQMEMMKTFPASDYHFLILVLPYKFYHGVEHANSTVLALGPGYKLMQDELYEDLIGVASHELFHAWNIKAIRPDDMLPYNYAEENYSTLGWVYEGFTTYYGDLFLARCGSFSLPQYLKEINFRLQKHMDNYGRFNLSVSESSFDSWLDGYTTGITWRKTYIYDEGSLIALMLDLLIRKKSGWKYSLDDLMVSLYQDFALQNRGYNEHDIKSLVNDLSSVSADDLFNLYINGRNSYDAYLQGLLEEIGCYISRKPSVNYYENYFGFKIIGDAFIIKVIQIAPSSPAEKAGLAKDDEIISVNNIKVENNFEDLCTFFKDQEIMLSVFTQKQQRTLKLIPGKETFYPICAISLIKDATEFQKVNFRKWCGLEHVVEQ